METTDQRQLAVERLKHKQRFQQSVVSYVVFSILMVVIWAVAGQGFFWPIFVIVGWGAGLAFQAWSVYGQKPITEDDIRREIDRG